MIPLVIPFPILLLATNDTKTTKSYTFKTETCSLKKSRLHDTRHRVPSTFGKANYSSDTDHKDTGIQACCTDSNIDDVNYAKRLERGIIYGLFLLKIYIRR